MAKQRSVSPQRTRAMTIEDDASSRLRFDTESRMKKEYTGNTFKMEPDSQIRFQQEPVRAIINRIFETKLKSFPYDPDRCKSLCMELTTEIKSEVKLLGFSRHKIVCEVVITSLNGQGMKVASRFVWDAKVDNYVAVKYKNDSLSAVAMVYAIYQE